MNAFNGNLYIAIINSIRKEFHNYSDINSLYLYIYT